MIEPTTSVIVGATGFVGRYLASYLSAQSDTKSIRCTCREAARGRQANPRYEWRSLEMERPETYVPALEGAEVAYYLVHGMNQPGDYETRERIAAQRFADAAARAGVRRIVYLGGVQPQSAPSAHLRSRMRTGQILRDGEVPCVELRAAMIIGHGSQSWKMVRDLSVRLPVMVLPSWLKSKSCPISIEDVVAGLHLASAVREEDVDCYSLPGPETLSAKEILLRVSAARGKRPLAIDLPVVTPRLSSYWIQWVTGADPHLIRELVEGLRSDLVGTTPSFWDLFPEHDLQPLDDAINEALAADRRALSLRQRAVESLTTRMTPSDQ